MASTPADVGEKLVSRPSLASTAHKTNRDIDKPPILSEQSFAEPAKRRQGFATEHLERQTTQIGFNCTEVTTPLLGLGGLRQRVKKGWICLHWEGRQCRN